MTRKLVFINDSNKSSSSSSAMNSPTTVSNSLTTTPSSDRLSIITTINSINKTNQIVSPSIKCSQLIQESSINNNNKENMLDIQNIRLRNNNSNNRNLRMRTSRLVTTFEELENLEARSRQPIDIVNLSKKSDDLFPRLDEISIHSSSPVHSNRKYFSFMTTNKQFNDINNKNANELKLKIINNQLVSDLNEVAETKHLKHCFSSSSSTSSSSTSSDYGLDSGCGSLGNRSSLVESSSDTSKLCLEPVKRKKTRTLTVLFDYETESKTYNDCLIKCHFSVKKGEQVKVIRDYDEKFYLVATCLDNRIGFIPKEYTVDLNELKQRYKDSILSSCNSTIDYNNNNSNNISDEICKKLTQL